MDDCKIAGISSYKKALKKEYGKFRIKFSKTKRKIEAKIIKIIKEIEIKEKIRWITELRWNNNLVRKRLDICMGI